MRTRLGVMVLLLCAACGSTSGSPAEGPTEEPLTPAGEACVAATCESVGANCGRITDGCGGTVSCGECEGGQSCGAGGPNKCGTGACTPLSCASANVACGGLADGCGAVLECGVCAAGSACRAGACVCTPKTCASAGAQCGAVDDGCGGALDCGSCAAGQQCSGNSCGTASCTKRACEGRCGQLSDGCGGTLSCGACPDYSCAQQDVGSPERFETSFAFAGSASFNRAFRWTPPRSGTYVFDQFTSVGRMRYSVHDSCAGAPIGSWPGDTRGQLQLIGGRTYIVRLIEEEGTRLWVENIWMHASPLEGKERSCTDRADSDGDGPVDCADPDCGGDMACMGPACLATDIRGLMAYSGSTDTKRGWLGDHPVGTLRWTAPEAGTWVFSSNRKGLRIVVGRGCSGTALGSSAMWSTYHEVGPVAAKATLTAGQNVVLFVSYFGDHPGYGSTNFDLRIFKDDGVETHCSDGFNDDADGDADCVDPDCGEPRACY